jgi:hypothetical protein
MDSDEGMWNMSIDLRTGIEAAKEAGLHEKVFDLQLDHLTAHTQASKDAGENRAAMVVVVVMMVMIMQDIILTFIGATNHAAGQETRSMGRMRSRPDLSTAEAKGKGGEKTSMERWF